MGHPADSRISFSKNMLNIIIIKFSQILWCIINKSINKLENFLDSFDSLNNRVIITLNSNIISSPEIELP